MDRLELISEMDAEYLMLQHHTASLVTHALKYAR